MNTVGVLKRRGRLSKSAWLSDLSSRFEESFGSCRGVNKRKQFLPRNKQLLFGCNESIESFGQKCTPVTDYSLLLYRCHVNNQLYVANHSVHQTESLGRQLENLRSTLTNHAAA